MRLPQGALLKAGSVTDLFDEVEEQIREERMAKWFKRIWPWALAGLVAVFIGIIGNNWWRDYSQKQSESQAAAMFAALDKAQQGDFTSAGSEFAELAKTGAPGYRVLALMNQAGALAAQGDKAGALKLFDEAAKVNTVTELQDLARLRAAYLAAELETAAQVDARLDPLIKGGGPYANLARELAGAEALSRGDVARASEMYSFLAVAPDVPQCPPRRSQQDFCLELRDRANLAMSVIESMPVASSAVVAPAAPGAAPAAPASPSPAAAPAKPN
jgi:hypothetical protein